MIQFRCQKCDKLLRVEESQVGKVGKCPGCSVKIRIPSLKTDTSKESPGRTTQQAQDDNSPETNIPLLSEKEIRLLSLAPEVEEPDAEEPDPEEPDADNENNGSAVGETFRTGLLIGGLCVGGLIVALIAIVLINFYKSPPEEKQEVFKVLGFGVLIVGGIILIPSISYLNRGTKAACPYCRKWFGTVFDKTVVAEKKKCMGLVERKAEGITRGGAYLGDGNWAFAGGREDRVWKERVPVIRRTYHHLFHCKFCSVEWHNVEVQEEEDFDI